jgi:hypothetical protein
MVLGVVVAQRRDLAHCFFRLPVPVLVVPCAVRRAAARRGATHCHTAFKI